MVPRLLLAALLAAALARPQDDCEIFGCSEEPEEPEEPEECDEIFGCDSEEEEPRTRTACFDDVNEIDDQENERNVFNDCNPERKCEYYAAQGYACANSWNCNEDRKIITDGKGLIDVRQLDDVSLDLSDHKCDDRDKICCKRPNYRADPPEDPERTPIEDKDEPNVKREVEEFSQCGRNEKAHTSLTGGAADQAQLAEFPHMCVLYRMEGRQRVYVGGASLIARNKVITVAHKFNVIQDKNKPVDWRDRKREFMVRCGEYDVKVEDAFLPSQESRVEEIYFHPQYEPRTVKNNLAIVRTRENFLYQKHIGPICLPRPNESFEGRKGRDCWSSGWGADKFVGDATYSDGRGRERHL